MTDTEILNWIEKELQSVIPYVQSGRGRDYIDFIVRVERDGTIYWNETNGKDFRDAVTKAANRR